MDSAQQHFLLQSHYPFRTAPAQPLPWLFEALFKTLLALISFGMLPAFLMLAVIAFPEPWRVPYLLLMVTLLLAAVPLSWTYRSTVDFDVERAEFSESRYLLGRRMIHRHWSRKLFKAVSYGGKGLPGGMTYVVRLHCIVEGFLLDSFLAADSLQQAREQAENLAKISGLELVEEQFSGGQTSHNDLRSNSWLLERLKRQGKI